MKCYKCGVKLIRDSKYCPRCGTIFSDNDVKRIGDSLENKLVTKYILEKKINCYNISFEFLIFNFFYAFYKKMYSDGVIALLGFIIFVYIATFGIKIIFGSFGFYALLVIFLALLSLFIYFYYVFNFNDIYMENARYRVNKLIKNNPGMKEKELVLLCEKDSKGNIWLPVILFFIIFFFFIIF